MFSKSILVKKKLVGEMSSPFVQESAGCVLVWRLQLCDDVEAWKVMGELKAKLLR